MTLAEIAEVVSLSAYDTLVAWAFRRAVGCPRLPSRGSIAVDVDRFGGVEELMGQRYGVRM